MRLIMVTHGKLKQFFFFTVIFCCLAFLLFVIHLWGYMQLTRNLAEADRELAHLQGVIAAQEKVQGELIEINSKISNLDKLFQIEMGEGALLILLSKLSKAMGVEVTELTTEKIKNNSWTTEVPLVLTVEGDYLDVLAFCQELEDNALHNLTLIRYIKITAGGKSLDNRPVSQSTAPASAPNRVTAQLGLSIYTSKSPQDKFSFDWERSNNPSIFYRPERDLSELPSWPAEGLQP